MLVTPGHAVYQNRSVSHRRTQSVHRGCVRGLKRGSSVFPMSKTRRPVRESITSFIDTALNGAFLSCRNASMMI